MKNAISLNIKENKNISLISWYKPIFLQKYGKERHFPLNRSDFPWELHENRVSYKDVETFYWKMKEHHFSAPIK